MNTEKLHIIPHQHQIQSKDRNELMGHKGMVIWFVGLSGSGKSTLASELERRLYEQGNHTYILDGDNIRSGLNSDLDFSDQSRVENIRRISEVAKLMVDAGLIVLTAFITPFEEERQKVKNLIGAENYFEIFVNCPIEECEKRDVKGLYAKARAGEISNFTGISSPFEEPINPDLKVPTHQMTVAEGVDLILSQLKDRL
ncbi:adenylyl-sulfate kinase [Croceimicrobium hydrocarbonivorans]|uniref:Adenylyl-sulfate kinase n=1 Tax=Croceimicrobium hydrocarbonivorans TaxID=2761580 RepID=A0A7H0VG88_9FLAO|nr:adenylyl-sulfate kinase [Croceimicrobium hydrocarbonivorans]QNR24736.1 adenylyl-sulfate kinase [Croceimicrobium hydrocarbonivorans]